MSEQRVANSQGADLSQSARERSRATRPAALRLTDADRERLNRYGSTTRAAVLRLLDIADEHEQCPRRPRRSAPPSPPVARFVPPRTLTSYRVDVPGAEPLVTTDHELAVATAREHGVRVRRT